MNDRYLLALDGGQTSTEILLAPVSLASAHYGKTSGFRYHTEPGQGAARQTEEIGDKLHSLMARARVAPDQIVAVGCSLSGAPPALAEMLRSAMPHAAIRMENDAPAAYAGTLWRDPGVALISGTGTTSFAKHGDRQLMIGGWGYLFGDAGGAWGIARRGLMAAIAYEDGTLSPTGWHEVGARGLHEAYLEYFSASDCREIVQRVYLGSIPRSEFSQAARFVLQSAESGNAVAEEIVHEAASELAGYVLAAVHRLDLESPVSVGLTGGVIRGSSLMQSFLARHVKEAGIDVERWIQGSSLEGALLFALELSGSSITPEVRARAKQLVESVQADPG